MKIDSLFPSIFPTFFICLLFGISTICPVRKNGVWFVSESIKFKLVHALWIYTMTIFMVTSSLMYENTETYYGGLAGFVVKTTKWVLIGQIFLNLCFTIDTSSKMRGILEDLSLVDEMMQKTEIRLNHKRHFFFEMAGIAYGFFYSSLIIHGGFSTGNVQKVSILPTTQFALFYATFMLTVYGYRFCMLKVLLLTRYWIINREINSFNLSTIQKYPKKITEKMELFFQIYFYLNKAGDKLKEINQMRFLALFAGLFLLNICTLFNAYYEYYIKEDFYSAFNWFEWTVLVWCGFALLCFTCHLTVNEAKRTGILLHKLLLEDLNKELSEKIMLFSNYISNTKLEYSACGFFPIDGTLFYMLVGATFNYMIIMLQFEEGNNDIC